MSHYTLMPVPSSIVFISVLICTSICIPVLAANSTLLPSTTARTAKDKLPGDRNNETFPIINNDGALKVTLDGEGERETPSPINLQRLLGLDGLPLVRRQAEDPFAACSADHLSPYFTEPAGCANEGQEFRLCLPGQYKQENCITDITKICNFCVPGETFMRENNNCTECKPCRECAPEEQATSPCNVRDDTKCEPRVPSTVSPMPGEPSSPMPVEPTCPPCPVTQVIITPEEATSTALYASPQETSGPKPTLCPKCKCNCSEECENLPGTRPSSSCPHETIVYVLVALFVVMTLLSVLMLGCILRRHQVYKDMFKHYTEIATQEERSKVEIAKLRQILTDNNIDIPEIEKCNGAPANQYCPGPSGAACPKRKDDIEMGNLNRGDKAADQNENDVPSIPNGVGSLNSLDKHPDERPRKSSTPKREVKPENPGPSSQAGLIDAEVHNVSGLNSTLDYPGRKENPAFEHSMLPSDIRDENDSLEPGDTSTIPCLKSLDHLPQKEDSDSEPSEDDKLLPAESSHKNDKTDLTKDAKEKFFLEFQKPEKPFRGTDPGASTSQDSSHIKRDKDPPNKLPPAIARDKERPSVLDLPTPDDSKSPDGVGSITSPKTESPQEPSLGGPELGSSPTTEQPLDKRKPSDTSNSASGAIPKPKMPINGSGDSNKRLGGAGKNGAQKLPNGSQSIKGNKAESAPPADKDKTHPPKGTISPTASGDLPNGKNGAKPIPKSNVASDLDFQNVAERLTINAQKRLYRQLKLKEADVDRAESSIVSIDFVERTISVLGAWRRKKGKDATVATLINAIKKAGDNDIADELEDLYR